MDALRRFVHALRVSTHALERDLGVSAAQLFVIRQIALAPRQSLRELAESTVSEVVARLVRRGLVERSTAAADRRRAELTLTSEGMALHARAPETVQERMLRGFDRLEPEQQLALAAGLDRWLAEAGLVDVSPMMFFEADSGQ
jgi:DNA-binding MarR family transcriptional regulator